MSSRAGSAFVPSSRMVVPFTVTRPSSINCSEARRDATPACERIFCKRSTATVYHEGTKNTKHAKKKALYKTIFVIFVAFCPRDEPAFSVRGDPPRSPRAAAHRRHV